MYKYIKLTNESNVSQTELARRIDVARSKIARMEKSLHSISLGTFIKYINTYILGNKMCGYLLFPFLR